MMFLFCSRPIKVCSWLLGTALFLLSATCCLGQLRDSTRVYFDVDSYLIRPADSLALAAFLEALPKGDSILNLRITGYCDSRGTNSYNDRLSLLRASRVEDFIHARHLVFSGNPKILGWGKSRPLATNGTAAGRALNRRVDLSFERVHPTTAARGDTIHATRPAPVQAPPGDISLLRKDTSLAGEGSRVVIRNLNFIGNRHIPVPGSQPVLEELLLLMQEHPGLQIELQGHICCLPEYMDGPDIDNNSQDLSVQRAKYVYDFLVAAGIVRERMRYRGFGASRKLFPGENTEQEQEANRRVEIRIISWNFSGDREGIQKQ
jgi:outer membrane protein OmpA-like peptidoglycan-associated protein